MDEQLSDVKGDKILEAIEQLHVMYEDQSLSLEEYQSKREQLLAQLEEPVAQERLQYELRVRDLSTRSGSDKSTPAQKADPKALIPNKETNNNLQTSSNHKKTTNGSHIELGSKEAVDAAVGSGQKLCDRFLLKALLGTGGMGQVFLAEDMAFGTEYALKVFHPWMMSNERSLQGFVQEFQFLERLTHPSVVRVYAINKDPETGFLFYTMENVTGQDLQSVIDKKEESSQGDVELIVPIDQAIRLIDKLSEVLKYIHKHKIVHRDLKPGNIMMLEDGTIKLLDFGIAKSLEKKETFHTGYKGTFFYIAPEQLVGGEEVKPAADIFSLGVLTYQLLTGEIPVGMAVLPSELNPELPETLDAVIRKAMHPRSKQRYQSIDEFLSAFHDALGPLARFSTSSSQLQANTLAERNTNKRHTSSVQRVMRPGSSGHNHRSSSGYPVIKKPKISDSRVLKAIHSFQAHHGQVSSMSLSADKTTLATSSHDKSIKLWELRSWFLLAGLGGEQSAIQDVQFSPDRERIASGDISGFLRVWDLKKSRNVHQLKHPAAVTTNLWSPSSQLLISGCADNNVRIWEATSGRLLYTLSGHKGHIESLDLDGSGQLLLSASLDGSCKVWEVGSGRELYAFPAGGGGVNAAAFCVREPGFVSVHMDGSARLWSLNSSRLLHTIQAHEGRALALAISPMGKWFCTGGEDGAIHVWHISKGTHVATLAGHQRSVTALVVTADGQRIISGGSEGDVKVWSTNSFVPGLI
ncbi:MAG TPA: hypothetical protein DCE42_15585 [Myxococcales bacterium]|nr:hypothetical protein [Deltaproteobacteria bacterium]HAA56186.1 hypothetical protein [Myxococcales bacterium]